MIDLVDDFLLLPVGVGAATLLAVDDDDSDGADDADVFDDLF